MPDYFSLSGYNRQYPTRVINGTDILEFGDEQQQILIGHTLSYCNELEANLNEALTKAEKYYELGVKEGYIVPPKSQEDINAELLKTIQALTDKIEKMEESNGRSNTNGAKHGESGESGANSQGRTGNKKVQQE